MQPNEKTPAPSFPVSLLVGQSPPSDAEWEIVDEHAPVRESADVFPDASDAIKVEITSGPIPWNKLRSNIGFPPPPNQIPFCSAVTIDQLTAQPGLDDDDVSLLKLPRIQAARRRAEQDAQFRTDWGAPSELTQCFVHVLRERSSDGARFRLHKGVSVKSSIQHQDEQISAAVVRRAFAKVARGYRYYGPQRRNEFIPRVQHLALRFAEVLAIQKLAWFGVSIAELRREAMTALSAVFDGLEQSAASPKTK